MGPHEGAHEVSLPVFRFQREAHKIKRIYRKQNEIRNLCLFRGLMFFKIFFNINYIKFPTRSKSRIYIFLGGSCFLKYFVIQIISSYARSFAFEKKTGDSIQHSYQIPSLFKMGAKLRVNFHQ